jgi:TOBE domain
LATRYYVRLGAGITVVAESQNRSSMPRAARNERILVGWAAEDMVAL